MQYVQDYNERMPLIASNPVTSSRAPFAKPFGWADAIQPYLKSTQVLQCPTEGSQSNTSEAAAPGFTDYWFNTRLAGLRQSAIREPSNVVMCGDGNDGLDITNARYNRSNLPAAWLDSADSPVRRHNRGMGGFLCADGSAYLRTPEFFKHWLSFSPASTR